jgi:hypothetical protein
MIEVVLASARAHRMCTIMHARTPAASFISLISLPPTLIQLITEYCNLYFSNFPFFIFLAVLRMELRALNMLANAVALSYTTSPPYFLLAL